MAFTNSTDSLSVNVISVTGEELLGEEVNADFYLIVGASSVIEIVYTKASFSNSGQQGVSISGFTGGDITTDSAITTIRIQNDGTDGFFAPSGTQMNIFPGDRTVVTTAELFVDGMVDVMNDPSAVSFGVQAADYLQFTAEKVDNNATTVTLRLTSKLGGTWSGITLSVTSDQAAVATSAVSITVAGTADTNRTGVTYELIGGRHYYTLNSNTRLQIGNAIANSTGTTSTIAARGTLNHDTFYSQIICERELPPSNATVNNYSVVTTHAGSVDQTIEPSVYNYGIQISSISGPKVITTTAQSISVGTIVLVPQNGGADDNKRFRNLVADTSVTLTTTFTNTTNWVALSDSPVVFSDGVGLVFTNSKTGDNFSPSFNLWFGLGQNGVYGGTSGHFMGATAHHITDKGGIINLNGGRVAGKFSLGIGSNATLRNYINSKFLIDDKGQPGGNEWVMRVTGFANIDTRDFTMVGGSISFVKTFGNYNSVAANENVGTTTAALQRENGGIALWNQSLLNMPNTVLAESYMTFRNPNFINNVVDIAPYQTSTIEFGGTRVQNCVQGSALNINGGETNTAANRTNNSNHYVIGTREIQSDVRSAVDASQQIGSIYGIDINRNANLSSPVVTINSISYSDDDSYTYFGKFSGPSNITEWTVNGGNGNTTNAFGAKLMNNSSDNEIALFTYSLTRAERVRGNQDEGIWRKNIRGLGDAGSATQDDFLLHLWSYENEYTSLTPNLAGSNTQTLEVRTSADVQVTDLRAAILIKNAGVLGTGLTLTNTSITTTTSNYTLDEIYDLIKIRKEQSEASMTLPTSSTLLVSGSGSTLSLGTLTIAIGTGTWGIGTTHTGVKHDTSLDLTDFTLTNLTIEAPILTNLPLTIPASTLIGTYTVPSSITSTQQYSFDTGTDVSKLVLVNESSSPQEILGKVSDDFDTAPSPVTGTNAWKFVEEKTIVISTGVTGTIGQVYATYDGTKIVNGTADGELVQGTDANGNITFTFKTTVPADFDIGIFIDGFNYSQLKIGNAISGTMSFVPIDTQALDFSGFSANTTLITELLTNLTVTDTSNTAIKFEFDVDTATTLTNHTAILGNDAALLTRRMVENDNTIKFLLAQTLSTTPANTIFTYDLEGWVLADYVAPSTPTTADPTRVSIVWNKAESKDLIINIYVKNASGTTQFDKIIDSTPTLSPSFAPSPFTNISQTSASLDFVDGIVGDQLDSRVFTSIK